MSNHGFLLCAELMKPARPARRPVVAAAVILPLGCEIEGLNDSKKLTEKKREALFDIICEKAVSFSRGMGEPYDN